jgi:uncharacterized protein
MTMVKQNRLDDIVTKRAAARIRAFCREATDALPNKIDKIMLFGSRARGKASRDSDYDLAIFVDGGDNRRAVDHLLADIAYQHILHGVHISPVSVSSNFLSSSHTNAFAQSLLRDGIDLL